MKLINIRLKKPLDFCLLFPLAFTEGKSQTSRLLHSEYDDSVKVSYICTWGRLNRRRIPNNIINLSDPSDFRMTTQSFDGLGGPLQTVLLKGSLITDAGTSSSSAVMNVRFASD